MVNSVSQGSSPTPALQLLESICISAKQPVLCLRGGGADNKRKEARIRKFAHISHDAESEGTSGSQAFKKPKKQATLTQNSESTPSLYQRKVVGVTENAETTEAIQDKPQRFICFIGTSNLLTTWIFLLTVAPFQAIYLSLRHQSLSLSILRSCSRVVSVIEPAKKPAGPKALPSWNLITMIAWRHVSNYFTIPHSTMAYHLHGKSM